MEKLKGKILKEFPLLESMVRIGDIINFEGPLLTLFEDCRNDYLYLFDWVDRDTDRNRWLVYQVTPYYVHRFIYGEISHRELFLSAISCYYSIEITRALKYENFVKIKKEDLPDSYIPEKDVFFDKCDCLHFPKIKMILSRLITSPQNLISKYTSLKRNKNIIANYYKQVSISEFLEGSGIKTFSEVNKVQFVHKDYSYFIQPFVRIKDSSHARQSD